jgi:bla regulator protein blaR1
MDVSFFAEMAWKSALIAGAALALAFAIRSRAAADRALVLRIGVAMLLLLPLIALVLPALPVEAWSAPAAAPPAEALAPIPSSLSAPVVPLAGNIPLSTLSAAAEPQPAQPTIWDDPTPLVILAYLGGLAMVGGRLLAGLALLRRWTRGARAITDPQWLDAFARAGGGRARLLVSDLVPSPLSWGWLNPVILIDPDTLAEPGEADAILAHELAHVARADWPALMLTRIAATLFWFNPVVWLLEREIVQQAEEAADCEAAAHVEPTRYAQTLLSWAQASGGALPANSIAPSGSALGRRVRAILDRRLRERPTGSALARIAVTLCIVIAAPVAAMKLVQAAAPTPPAPAMAPAAPPAPPVPPAPYAPHAPMAPMAPMAPAAPPAPPAPIAELPDMADVARTVDETLAAVLPQIPQIVADATASVAAIDPEAIDRATDEALREQRPALSRQERQRIRTEVRRAVEQARRSRGQAQAQLQAMGPQLEQARRERARAQAELQAMRPQIELAMRQAREAAHNAPRIAAASMAGMAQGAAGMEQGAAQMERQAAQFRNPAYRAREIERARARGERVTDAQLIEAAESLQEGARGMREGAREMRQAAERVHAGHDDD